MSIQLSLITPSGHLTLGNLIGALAPMVAAQESGDVCYFGLSDLHALTVPRDPDQVRSLVRELMILMLAAGLDRDRVTLLRQSQVPAHAELSYLLESTVHMGELNRMIQFKEKGRGRPGTRASLFTYPALMAADILLYRPTEVPVGDDQRQHVELTRDLAIRFNHTYGEVFTIPRVVIPPTGARIMDLQDPTTKMSKSREDGRGTVYLLDPPDVVRRKIARAVTDSEAQIRHDVDAKPGVSNLLEIIAACTGCSLEQAAAGLDNYGALKRRATDAVIMMLEPVQQRCAELAADPGLVEAVYAAGAARARGVTAPVLTAAQQAMGL